MDVLGSAIHEIAFALLMTYSVLDSVMEKVQVKLFKISLAIFFQSMQNYLRVLLINAISYISYINFFRID